MLKQYKSIIKRLAISLSFLIALGNTSFSQITINGPICVESGVNYSYYLTGDYDYYNDYFTWSINGGVSAYGNTSESGTSLVYLPINFTSSSGYITVYYNGNTYNLSVSVTSALSPGSITSNGSQTINYNYTPSIIYCSGASGGYCSPSYTYSWEKSTDGTNWTSTGYASQNLNYSQALTQTTYFRRKVTESYSSSIGYSNTATVYVNPPLSGGTVGASQNIFAGDYASNIGGSPASGGTCDGNHLHQWEYSTDGTNYYEINGANGTSYNPGQVNITTYYRRRVNCDNDVAYSNVVSITVHQHLTAGSISSSVYSTQYNTSPGQISGTVATGGICSSPTYQWQSSSDGYNWSPISNSNVQSYTPGNLTAHTYFRRMVTCGSETLYSNTVLINVYNPLTVGTLTGANSPVYTDEFPGTFSVNPPSGGSCNGDYTYKWYQSTDGGQHFSLILGANGPVYTLYLLSTTTQFYVKVSCGSQEISTNVRTITVYPALNPGSITTSSFEIPFNTTPTSINATPSSGGNCGGTYTYSWQRSPDNSTWEYITGAGQNLSFSGPQTQGYYYRRETDCAGIKKYTNSIYITVACFPGEISCSQVITPAGSPSAFTLSNSGGGAPGVVATYQWESSPDEINWTTVSGATSTTYTPSSPSITTYYRVKTTCDSRNGYSNTVRIKVKGAVADNKPNTSTASSTETAISMPSYPSGTDANNQNYIRSRNFSKPGITDLTTANAQTGNGDVAQVTDRKSVV